MDATRRHGPCPALLLLLPALGLSAAPAASQTAGQGSAQLHLALPTAAVGDLNELAATATRDPGAALAQDGVAGAPAGWAAGEIGFGEVEGGGGRIGFDVDRGGAVAGADVAFGAGFRGGLVLAYRRLEVELDGAAGTGEADGYGGVATLAYGRGPLVLTAAGGLVAWDVETDRRTPLGRAVAGYEATGYVAALEGRYTTTLGPLQAQTVSGLTYAVWDGDDDLMEGGAGALRAPGAAADALRLSWGARLFADLELGGDWALTASASARYVHDLTDIDRRLTLRTAGGAPVFVRGAEPGYDSARLEAGVAVRGSDRQRLTLDYRAELRDDATDQSVAGAVRLRF